MVKNRAFGSRGRNACRTLAFGPSLHIGIRSILAAVLVVPIWLAAPIFPAVGTIDAPGSRHLTVEAADIGERMKPFFLKERIAARRLT